MPGGPPKASSLEDLRHATAWLESTSHSPNFPSPQYFCFLLSHSPSVFCRKGQVTRGHQSHPCLLQTRGPFPPCCLQGTLGACVQGRAKSPASPSQLRTSVLLKERCPLLLEGCPLGLNTVIAEPAAGCNLRKSHNHDFVSFWMFSH